MIAFGRAVLRRFVIGLAVVVAATIALVFLRQPATTSSCEDLIATHAVDACWVVDEAGTLPGGAR